MRRKTRPVPVIFHFDCFEIINSCKHFLKGRKARNRLYAGSLLVDPSDWPTTTRWILAIYASKNPAGARRFFVWMGQVLPMFFEREKSGKSTRPKRFARGSVWLATSNRPNTCYLCVKKSGRYLWYPVFVNRTLQTFFEREKSERSTLRRVSAHGSVQLVTNNHLGTCHSHIQKPGRYPPFFIWMGRVLPMFFERRKSDKSTRPKRSARGFV